MGIFKRSIDSLAGVASVPTFGVPSIGEALSRNQGVQTLERGGQTESAADVSTFARMVESLRDTNYMLTDDNEQLRESVEDLQRAVDELGWTPLGAVGADASGLALDTIRKALTNTRALVAANPLVKRGVRARVGFIWGEGVQITGRNVAEIMKRNALHVFSDTAYEELETAAATDGNVCFVLNRTTRKIVRVPLSQINDWTVDPDDGETIQFIKRVWSVKVFNTAKNTTEIQQRKVWYPTIEFVAQNPGTLPAAIGDTPVEQGSAINVVSVNKQIGWNWGIPDLLSVLFWSKAYKEFLEANYTLVRALARFAFKVMDTRPKGQGAKSAAIKLAQPANTAGIDAGGTTTLPGGMDLVAVNKAGANVSFEAGRPLAAMVAAGLEVPLSVILAETEGGTNNAEATLDPATVKAIQARQRLWTDEFVRMLNYLGATTAKVIFPPIQSAPIHRVVQAIITAASSGTLFPTEVRDLIVKALSDYGIEAKSGMPKPGEWAAYANKAQQNPGTSPLNTPDATGTGDTGRSPAGALADGDHELRPTQ